MHRFFIPPENIRAGSVHFGEAVSRQMVQVLRLKPDEFVIALDGLGKEYQVRLTDLSVQSAEGEIESVSIARGEPSTRLSLYLCLTQREKFEWMLQKCTEVGASSFIPVISSRSLAQDIKEVSHKYERWQRILQEAAEQSHRGVVPALKAPLRLEQALEQAAGTEACRLIPWEEEKSVNLRQALQDQLSRDVIVLVGPEGGFSKEEVIQAQAANFISVSLGKRILRMETAAVVASALVLYERGDMNCGLE